MKYYMSRKTEFALGSAGSKQAAGRTSSTGLFLSPILFSFSNLFKMNQIHEANQSDSDSATIEVFTPTESVHIDDADSVRSNTTPRQLSASFCSSKSLNITGSGARSQSASPSVEEDETAVRSAPMSTVESSARTVTREATTEKKSLKKKVTSDKQRVVITIDSSGSGGQSPAPKAKPNGTEESKATSTATRSIDLSKHNDAISSRISAGSSSNVARVPKRALSSSALSSVDNSEYRQMKRPRMHMYSSVVSFWREAGGITTLRPNAPSMRNPFIHAQPPPPSSTSTTSGTNTSTWCSEHASTAQLQLAPWPFIWEHLEHGDLMRASRVCRLWRRTVFSTIRTYNMDQPLCFNKLLTSKQHGRQIETLMRLSPNLCHLNIGRWDVGIGNLLGYIGSKCTQVVTLCVSLSNPLPTPGTVEHLSRRCRNLRILNLQNSLGVKSAHVPSIFALSRLQELSLHGIKKLGHKVLRDAPKSTTLRSLDIGGCNGLNRYDVMSDRFPSLRRLRLDCDPYEHAASELCESAMVNPLLHNDASGERLRLLVQSMPDLEELHVTTHAPLLPSAPPDVPELLARATSMPSVATHGGSRRVMMPPLDVDEAVRKRREAIESGVIVTSSSTATSSSATLQATLNNVWMSDEEMRRELRAQRQKEAESQVPPFVTLLKPLRRLRVLVMRVRPEYAGGLDTLVYVCRCLVEALPSLRILLLPTPLYFNSLHYKGVADADAAVASALDAALRRYLLKENRSVLIKLGYVQWCGGETEVHNDAWMSVTKL